MTPDIGSAAELPIDVDGIRAYSEMVHSLAAPFTDNGKLVICGFGEALNYCNQIQGKPAQKLRPEIRHVYIGDIEKTVDQIVSLARKARYNAYFSLSVYRDDLRPTLRENTEDIRAVLGLVADFDDSNSSRWSERLPLKPQLVLETSRSRFQAFYFFEQPQQPAAVEPIARKLKE